MNKWRLNNIILNNEEVTKDIERKKNPRNKWQGKQDNSKPVGCSKSSFNWEVYNNAILSQETKQKYWRHNLTLHLRHLEEEEQKQQQQQQN